uniref:NADH-ubiquinone oxidoreductase chain 4 n=1 Tax=Trimma corallinum TaxID=1402054 RepID=A0A455TR00_9GOBI|nr:NADH dehydrogenase subunit 4 [Trimma corallinum]
MLKLIFATIIMLPMAWLMPPKLLWPSIFFNTMVVAFLSFSWVSPIPIWLWRTNCGLFGVDGFSGPLVLLTCWLLPLMILASHRYVLLEPMKDQRAYVTTVLFLQLFLIMAFSATDIFLFYVMFEATLVPTLFLITRWGSHRDRLKAGTYFLFYTLMGSLPFLVALLLLVISSGTASALFLPHLELSMLGDSIADKAWWAACLMGFMVKLPLYGIHLWLPKAHVEAPIVGSMVLAGVLLKLGAYGIVRLLEVLAPATQKLCYPIIALALWGAVMAGINCTRQHDLKSLIAYSSVSHMGLVAAGTLVQTPWGFTGALMLMITHGLTSSALFFLANTLYERTHTRTIMVLRGLQIAFPLLGTWWFMFSVANLGLPPLPSFLAELKIFSALLVWSDFVVILLVLCLFITAMYSLYMFLLTQRGGPNRSPLPENPIFCQEHLTIYLHGLPFLFLMVKIDTITAWF